VAPEVIEMSWNSHGPDARSADIWSLGCTVIELLTGQPPYYDCNPMTAMFRIVQDPHPPFPENISEDCEAFLLRCFERNPKDRATAQELQNHPWIRKSNKHLNVEGKGKVC
jgi:serine/threonine protein kinase